MHCRWEATKRSLEVTPVSLPGVRCYEFIFGDDSMLKRAALFLILLFAFLGKIQAQDAVVTRNVYLRADPSTENDPITKLLPPASVHLDHPLCWLFTSLYPTAPGLQAAVS
jgi:hypothetical protein